MRKGRKGTPPFKKSFQSSFKMKKTVRPTKINSLSPIEPTIDSSIYLGINSSFINTDVRYKNPSPEFNTKEIHQNLEVAMTLNTDRNKLNFDPTADKNDLDGFMNSSEFSNTKIKNAPNQFKALVASRSDAARNGILKSKTDILKDPSTKVATEMMFQATQKIQMFAGYKKNKNGMDNLDAPIWRTIDPSLINEKTPVLCRMVYNDQPELGLRPSDEFKLPVQNSTFIISSVDIKTPNRPKVSNPFATVSAKLSSKKRLSSLIVYASSITIKQKRSGAVVTRGASNVPTSPSMPSSPSTPTSSPSTPPPAPTTGGGY